MNCIVCDTPVTECLNLGSQPLANNLLNNKDESTSRYSLGLDYCQSCGHGQLKEFVDPKILFEKYLYASGTSNTLSEYFSALAASLVGPHGKNKSLLDIASNDGSFLRKARDNGFNVLGVDPAQNLVAEANAKGLDTICDFFPTDLINKKFDVITAMNVCAHNPDPISFLNGVRETLKSDGVAYIQTSQALMLNSGEFDTIYHEHYSFFTVSSMRRACERVGLRLSNFQLVPIHGVSLIFHITHDGRETDTLNLPGIELERLPLVEPSEINKTYEKFHERAQDTLDELKQTVSNYKNAGYQIVLAGVAAKALTVYQASGITLDFMIDEAVLKIGKYVPGHPTPIGSFDDLNDSQKYLIIIGAWNFFEEITSKLSMIYPNTEMTFLRYFPDLEIK